MVDDVRVILVKLADRLHNMRTLEHLSPERQKRIARETIEIYAPIALRLGMSRIRGELEDLSFSYLNPVTSGNIIREMTEKEADFTLFISHVTSQLREVLDEHGISAQLESRIKRAYSIYQKMKRQKIDLNQVYDLVAIRVLVDSVRDCYTVLGLVNNLWNPVPGRIKDFIAMPRNNMYQSVHTTVVGGDGQPFEVQIRTHEMHRVAEEGIAAHWKYKEGKLEQHDEDKRFLWLRHLLEWQKEVRAPHQFLSNLKIDLYPGEVYIFTPKGEVVTLPRGSTALDFAYHIHTEVGHKCVGAKVNKRIVPLKYRLHTGEIVEILTASEARPSRDWLNIVRTSRARTPIRRWLNQRQKEEAVGLGRKLLEKEFRKHKLSSKKYEDRLESVLGHFGVSRVDELIASIGFGRISARLVVNRLEPKLDGTQAEEKSESKLGSAVRRMLRRRDSPILVKGHSDLLVYRARCCNPIKGEDVVGYITVGKGISVHSTSCPNLENLLLNSERKVEVSWTSDGDETRYPVRLSIHTGDRTGILADITGAVAGSNANIIDARARLIDGNYGLVEITLEVSDTEHLEKIITYIKKVDGVRDVDRGKQSSRT